MISEARRSTMADIPYFIGSFFDYLSMVHDIDVVYFVKDVKGVGD